jgi:hypothetical protein
MITEELVGNWIDEIIDRDHPDAIKDAWKDGYIFAVKDAADKEIAERAWKRANYTE